MRVGWVQQVLTDWMGDDAFLEMFDTTTHLPNIIGDIVRFTGRVIARREEGGRSLVDLEIRGERQDGELSIKGTATIRLPRKAR